jgi:hypothetical protein
MFPVPDEQAARYLGLTRFHVGAARADVKDPAPRVLGWWAVTVSPSFAPAWVVGALHEELWTGGPDPEWVAVRGFVLDREGAATTDLEDDPVLAALAALNPFRVVPTHRQKGGNFDEWHETRTLDGLGYGVRWGTRATHGAFRFSNPRVDWLWEFERVLFGFARRVVSLAEGTRFERHLGTWAAYRESI